MTGNGKLCKIYFKRLFLQNVLAFIDLFYWYHYICYFIFSDCMWHHVCLICTEEDTTGVVLEHFANFTVKTTIKQKPTIIELIIQNTRYTLDYATSFVLGLRGSSQTPGVTHLPFSSHLINNRNKKIKPYIYLAFLFCKATLETKRGTHLSSR